MMDQYSSEDNQAIETPGPLSAVSLAEDNREPLVAQCTETFERDPSLTYTSRARNPPSIFAPTTRKSMGNFP